MRKDMTQQKIDMEIYQEKKWCNTVSPQLVGIDEAEAKISLR